MDKLRYKFKKIIRFINKILRLILIFGCLASFFAFSASAAVYVDKEGFYDIFGTDVTADIECETGYQTENVVVTPSFVSGGSAYAAYVPSLYVSLTKLNLSFSGSASIGGVIKAGQYLVFKGNIGIRDRVDDSAFITQLQDATCKVVLNTDEKSFVLGTLNTEIIRLDSYRYIAYNYDFKYTIPNDFDKYNNPVINFVFDLAANGVGLTTPVDCFIIKSTSMKLWFGDEQDAPIYPEYNSNTAENIASMEDGALEDAAEGLDEVGSFFNVFENIFYNGGPTVAGLQFIGMFMNDLYLQIPWLNILLVISLSLGVVTVILGVFNYIKKGG